jgi:hypothetical protein
MQTLMNLPRIRGAELKKDGKGAIPLKKAAQITASAKTPGQL